MFTDIEGSTRLWDRHPDEMGQALRLHDRILHDVIRSHGGHVFKTVGDAFCAAFSDAPSAAAAAVDVQVALGGEDWPPPGRLHVRMALHTGRAEERDGDYYGRPLNRCARIEGLAHGDQVLLSEETAALLAERLPPGAGVEDLGNHRLRDLTRPERIFRLTHPELRDSFPPLRSLDARPNNLPVRQSSFIGRQRELTEVKNRLLGTQLLTLKGMGGLGKTSLALQAAADLLDDFPDGIWFIDLAPLAEPALVVQSTAAALGVREEPGQPLVETLVDRLRDRALLLILDNCEHLIDACATLAQEILRRCPKTRILATSREVLGVPGEQVWRVPPMDLPEAPERSDNAAAGVDPVAELLHNEAASLFVERAQQASPSFALTAKNAPAVAEICRRLDGIALAIELAAARVPMLPPERIAERLDESLRLLSKGPRTARKHQATLRAAIDWSYDLCTEDEQRLLARLAVFHGGWSLEAAQAICADEDLDEWDILDLLTQLADRSLVETDEGDADNPRHHLLETIRQYADEKLAGSTGSSSGSTGSTDDVAAIRGRHLVWYGELAEQGDSGLKGAEQAAWLTRLETEHDNLRAALDWSADRGSTADGLRLGGQLWRFWHRRGYLSEGRRRLEAVLACSDASANPEAFAAALHGAGTLAVLQGDLDTARVQLEQCLEIRRGAGDLAGTSATLNNLAMVANQAGDNVAARRILDESLAIKRQLGDHWAIANTLNNLATADYHEGSFDRSRAMLHESLRIWQALGDQRHEASTLLRTAIVDQISGNNRAAEEEYKAGLAIFEALGDNAGVAEIKREFGRLLHAEGEIDTAREILGQSLDLAREQDDSVGAARALIESGRIDRYQGNPDAAEAAYRESATLLSNANNPFTRSTLDNAVGRLACERGDLIAARRHLEMALSSRYQMGRKPWIVSVLESFAILAVAESQYECAITLASAADVERRSLGMPLESFETRELQTALDRATAALTTHEVDAARATGHAMSIDAAVDLAMGSPTEIDS
jgi:predicted ATPase/class 3 adenylate cyclase/Tfp pilus assembly protein PilF